jgi:hypothetical protein
MAISRVPATPDEFRAYAEADIARRNGILAAPPGASSSSEPRAVPTQTIQVLHHPTLKFVEFQYRGELEIETRSVWVPEVMLEITYYAMLGAKLAPVLAALSGGGNPGPPVQSTPLSLHRETPP